MIQSFANSQEWRLQTRVCIAIAIFAAALGARFVILPVDFGLAYITFYPALTVAFLQCGTGPGLLVTVLSAATAYGIFFPPYWSFADKPVAVFSAGVIIAYSIPLGLMVHRLRVGRETLRKLTVEQRATLDSTILGIAKLRAQRIVWASRGLETLLGYAPDELRGKPTSVTYPSGAAYEATGGAGYSQMRDGRTYRAELQLARKDGTPIWVDLSGEMQDPASHESLWVLTDITARKTAEETLRTSQAFLEKAGALAGVGSWQYDVPTQTLTWSAEMCRLHDLPAGHRPTRTEVLGYHTEDSRPIIARAVEAAIEHGTPYDLELPRLSATGRLFWARSVGMAEVADGRTVRIVGALQDVTKRRLIEQALRENHELTRITLESIADAVITADRSGRIVWLNPVAERLTGWSKDAAAGRPSHEVFVLHDQDTGEAAADPVAGCLTRAETTASGDRALLVSRDGSRVAAEASAAPIHDSNRLLVGAVLVFRDVSEQRRLSDELRYRERQQAEARARLDALFLNSQDAMVVVRLGLDDSFTYEAVNPVWARKNGLSADQAVGRTLEQCLPPDRVRIARAAFRQCVEEQRACAYEYRVGADQPGLNQATDWEASVVPVFDDEGVVHRVVSVARDVTQRNQLEAGLRQMQRMDAVGQLTAGLAHDFNNLLQAILGALEFLHDERDLTPQARECIAISEDAASRGATLVHRLLAFSSKQPLAPVAISPASVFEDLSVLLATTVRARVRIETRIDADWIVRADGSQLESCLFNLVLNARDAMPRGGVLRLSADNMSPAQAQEAGLPPGEYVRFEVTDTGTGMAPETLARALEPFFTTKPIGQGTGLGLSMVQGFARQSGGDVRISSEQGVGTSVELWLPRDLSPASEPPRPGCAESSDPGFGRVLIVDDEPAVRRMLEMVLRKAGFSPIAFEDGDAALAHLQAGNPCDLLITDQSMPAMSGSDLIAAGHRFRPGLPTILITGYEKVSGLDQLQGRVTVLRKPFAAPILLQQVQALLGSVAPRDAGPHPTAADLQAGRNVVLLRPAT